MKTPELVVRPRADVIDDLLERDGHNRAWLAHEIDRSENYVHKLLAGDRRLSWSLACDMAYALRVRPTTICEIGQREAA